MKNYILVLLLLPTILSSQKIDHLASFKDMGSESYFRFNYDNDFFAASDKNYTQGYSFEYANRSLKKNPINYLFINPKAMYFTYGLALEHIGYTPSDFVSPDIQLDDRPFAAAIYLKSFAIATDTISKSRLSQSLSLGLIGPGAFGREMQTAIHKLIENKTPGGWDNQIQNDLVLNYKIGYEQQIFNYTDFISLQAVTSLQLGTLFTNASVGFNSTIGLLDNPFSRNSTLSKFKFYAFVQPTVHVVGFDATLQGGIFTNDNPYTISSKNIERFTAQIDYGLILKYRKLYLEYTRTTITKEFTSGNSANWGGFKVGFLFN
ncbi:lipid A deacylase LpxR family protein [uncultured Maribacter sp.]|uniref:lipid A deacylase LpxR family protein n=1 Tax=uncultured Maribacter sp. TaxID=431308 RepID=UPI0026135EFB|nr:lipid A deacylase LpxR family protein [uncultured Maribacter sp.]